MSTVNSISTVFLYTGTVSVQMSPYTFPILNIWVHQHYPCIQDLLVVEDDVLHHLQLHLIIDTKTHVEDNELHFPVNDVVLYIRQPQPKIICLQNFCWRLG